MQQKIVIYSALTRLWGNKNTTHQPHGTLSENGSGKLRDFTPEALAYIRSLGATHVWYIGLLEHATKTDYSAQGIRPDHPDTVKGRLARPMPSRTTTTSTPTSPKIHTRDRQSWMPSSSVPTRQGCRF